MKTQLLRFCLGLVITIFGNAAFSQDYFVAENITETSSDMQSIRFDDYMDKIATTLRQVNNYKPGDALLHEVISGYNYGWYAVSDVGRKEFYKDRIFTLEQRNAIEESFNTLKNAMIEKAKTYIVPKSKYPVQNTKITARIREVYPAERFTIYYVGLSNLPWKVRKNYYGIPESRSKEVIVHLKNKQATHSFCFVSLFSYKQIYEGGGVYGEGDIYDIERETLAGCPKGK